MGQEPLSSDYFQLEINLPKLNDHLEDGKKLYKTLEGKDVILFCGNIGVGKSTTCNFLAGDEIIEQQPEEAERESVLVVKGHEKFPIGHESSSKTQTLAMHYLPEYKAYLVDSPGFEDPKGPEVDIANAVALAQAISRCKSCRIVLLADLGGASTLRGNYFAIQLSLLARFIKDLEDHVESIEVLFTHTAGFTYTKAATPISKLLKDKEKQQQQVAPVLCKLFEKVLAELKDHKEKLFIRPTDSSTRVHLLDRIMSIKPLDPKYAIGCPLPATASSALMHQCRLLQHDIKGCFKAKAFGTIQENLSIFETVAEEVRLPQLKELYQDTKNDLVRSLGEVVTNTEKGLEAKSVASVQIGFDILKLAQKPLESFAPECFQTFVKLRAILSDLVRREMEGGQKELQARKYPRIATHLEVLKQFCETLSPKHLSRNSGQLYSELTKQVLEQVRTHNQELTLIQTDLGRYSNCTDDQIEKLIEKFAQSLDSFEGVTLIPHIEGKTRSFYKAHVRRLEEILQECDKEIKIALDTADKNEVDYKLLSRRFSLIRGVSKLTDLRKRLNKEFGDLVVARGQLETVYDLVATTVSTRLQENDYPQVVPFLIRLYELGNIEPEVYQSKYRKRFSTRLGLVRKNVDGGILRDLIARCEKTPLWSQANCVGIRDRLRLLDRAVDLDRFFTSSYEVEDMKSRMVDNSAQQSEGDQVESKQQQDQVNTELTDSIFVGNCEAAMASSSPFRNTQEVILEFLRGKVEVLLEQLHNSHACEDFPKLREHIQALHHAALLAEKFPQIRKRYIQLVENVGEKVLAQGQVLDQFKAEINIERVFEFLEKLAKYEQVLQALCEEKFACEVKNLLEKESKLVSSDQFLELLCLQRTNLVKAVCSEIDLRLSRSATAITEALPKLAQKDAKIPDLVELIKVNFEKITEFQVLDKFTDKRASHVLTDVISALKKFLQQIDNQLMRDIGPNMRLEVIHRTENGLEILRKLAPLTSDPDFAQKPAGRSADYKEASSKLLEGLPVKLRTKQFKHVVDAVKKLESQVKNPTLDAIADHFQGFLTTVDGSWDKKEVRVECLGRIAEVFCQAKEAGMAELPLEPSFESFDAKLASYRKKIVSDLRLRFKQQLQQDQFTEVVTLLNDVGSWAVEHPSLHLVDEYGRCREAFIVHMDSLPEKVEYHLKHESFNAVAELQKKLVERKSHLLDFDFEKKLPNKDEKTESKAAPAKKKKHSKKSQDSKQSHPQMESEAEKIKPLYESSYFDIQASIIGKTITAFFKNKEAEIKTNIDEERPDKAFPIIFLLEELLNSSITIQARGHLKVNLKNLREDVEALAKHPPIDIHDPEKLKPLIQRICKARIGQKAKLLEQVSKEVLQVSNNLQQIAATDTVLCSADIEELAEGWKLLKNLSDAFPRESPYDDFVRRYMEQPMEDQRKLVKKKIDRLFALLTVAQKAKPPVWAQVRTFSELIEAAEGLLGPFLKEQKSPAKGLPPQKSIAARLIEVKETVAQVVQEQEKFLKEAMECDFTKVVSLERISKILSVLKKNGELKAKDGITCYDQALVTLTEKVIALKPLSQKYLSSKEFAKIASLLDNLRATDIVDHELADHTKFYGALQDTRQHIITQAKNELETIIKECERLFESSELKAMEPLLKQGRKMQVALGHVPEIFSPGFDNPVLETLKSDVSKRVREFKEAGEVKQEQLADLIVSLKEVAYEIGEKTFQKHVDIQIDYLLTYYLAKPEFHFQKLSVLLTTRGAFGVEVTTEFPHFQALLAAEMNEAVASMPAKVAIDQLEELHLEEQKVPLDLKNEEVVDSEAQSVAVEQKGLPTASLSSERKGALEKAYEHYEAVYKRGYIDEDKVEQKGLLPKYLLSALDVAHLVNETRRLVAPVKFKVQSWKDIHSILPTLLAHVSAAWTIHKSKQVHLETKSEKFCTMPSPLQIISIFRLLDLDMPPEGYWNKLKSLVFGGSFKSHFIQVPTGQGKSILLGLLSTMLALLGFRVDCACYSSYLSRRDYAAFRSFFDLFGVADLIEYSTLSALASKFINQQGDIRQATINFLDGKSSSEVKAPSEPRILLIDETDVFFSRKFYGEVYVPAAIIDNDDVYAIADYIWRNRSGKPQIGDIRNMAEYKNLLKKYSGKQLKEIIDSAIMYMCLNVNDFNDPPYCSDGKSKRIGYKEHGTVNLNLSYGYKTMFAYFNEKDRGTIPEANVRKIVGLHIKCGELSYAEVPTAYKCILGPTGTLKTLSNFEVKVVTSDYKIENMTIAPSIYARPKSLDRPRVVVAEDEIQYLLSLKDDLMKAREGGRPVLVFFETEEYMKKVAASDYFRELNINLVTEDDDNLDFSIKRATMLGQITFLPRILGRGLDFICRDEKVQELGGVHVIQTFLSEERSEEIQIKGRTGRKGQRGTYSLVLLLSGLIKFGISSKSEVSMAEDSALYEFLDQKRFLYFEQESQKRSGIIERSRKAHLETLAFRNMLFKENSREAVLDYLQRQNSAPRAGGVRTVILCDATQSMSSLYAEAKRVIQEMIKRMRHIAKTDDLDFKWIAYRDYSDKLPIQESAWTRDASVLKSFMEEIKCEGGDDWPEAVELGLKAVNDLEDPCNLVILIGDAEPHLERKGEYLTLHKRIMETDYIEQCQRLAEKGIKVISFHMKEYKQLRESFENIAKITQGSAMRLQNYTNFLDSVCETVVKECVGVAGVEEYRKTYTKSYSA